MKALDVAIPLRKRKPQTMGFTPPVSRGATPGEPGAEAEAEAEVEAEVKAEMGAAAVDVAGQQEVLQGEQQAVVADAGRA